MLRLLTVFKGVFALVIPTSHTSTTQLAMTQLAKTQLVGHDPRPGESGDAEAGMLTVANAAPSRIDDLRYIVTPV